MTTTHTVKQTLPVCAPGRCGGSTCPVQKKKPIDVTFQKVAKRGNPADGQWPDPSDLERPQEFIMNQLFEITNGRMESRYAPKLVRHDPSPDAHVTANWVTFKDNVEALALEGLYGCTSIVLVSQRGAWMSHIWETAFLEHNSDDFEYMVTDDLLYRPPPGDPLFEYYEYGLENLKNSKEHGDPGIMFGDEDFDSTKLEMQAFIITPRQHLHPAFYYDANNEIVNEDILKDIDHQKGTVKYPEKVNRLVGVITETYGAIPVEVVDYNPVFLPREKWETWVIEGSLLDDNGISKSAEEILTDLTIGTPRGKVLIQYQPAKTCVEMAKWRLWVEGQQASNWAEQWTPTYDQIFSFPGESSGLARRQGVCARPIKTSPPGPTAAETPLSVTLPVQGSPSSAGNEDNSISGPTTQVTQITQTAPSNSSPKSIPLISTVTGLFTVKTTTAGSISTSYSLSLGAKYTPSLPALSGHMMTSTSSPPAPSTTSKSTSSSRIAIISTVTFSKPPPPPPSPLPSEAVYIQYLDGVVANGEVGHYMFGSWYMIPVTPVNAQFNPCNTEPVGWEMSLHENSMKNATWPVSFNAQMDVFGKKKCKYTRNDGSQSFGKFSCEDVAEFDCTKDLRANQKTMCNTGGVSILSSFTPRVRCVIPARDLRKVLEEINF